jgi:hypothetical protein
VKINTLIHFSNHKHLKFFLSLSILIMMMTFISTDIFAQEPYYFHTIHSHGLSFIGGRTAKINYMYQISRIRQLKVSGTYIYDGYNQGRDHIKSNIYLGTVQFQYKLINNDKFFLNMAIGGGGYNLVAKDRLNIKLKEWRFNFVGSLQAELYIVRNVLALTVDYDILYMPWSKIYEFMHVPTAGLTLFFF